VFGQSRPESVPQTRPESRYHDPARRKAVQQPTSDSADTGIHDLVNGRTQLYDGHGPAVSDEHGFYENAERIPDTIADDHNRKRSEDHIPTPENTVASFYVR